MKKNIKFKDIQNKTLKTICKENLQNDCIKCPFRRTRTDKDGKEHELFCYPVLKSLAYAFTEEQKETEYEIELEE